MKKSSKSSLKKRSLDISLQHKNEASCKFSIKKKFCTWLKKRLELKGLLLLSSLRSRRRYHRAQRDSICLSVCCLSVVCLSVCLSSVVCLSVCRLSSVCLSVIKLLPAYGTDHYQNSYLGSLGHCEDQSRFDIDRNSMPPQKMTPQNENFYFLTYWLEILFITSWPLPHHKSCLESQLKGAQLRMRRSISFSFVCIDLKFCR